MKKRVAAGMMATVLAAWLPVLAGLLFLAAMPAWTAAGALPAGVPNIYDPEVRGQFQPTGVSNLLGNPDFPLLYVVNQDGEKPQAMLIGLDARNGKATWSLTGDPIVLIVVFSERTTIQRVYVDTGFANLGKPSGDYAAVDERNATALPNLLKAISEVVTRTYI